MKQIPHSLDGELWAEQAVLVARPSLRKLMSLAQVTKMVTQVLMVTMMRRLQATSLS